MSLHTSRLLTNCKKLVIASAPLALVVLAVFSRSLKHEFLDYDDGVYFFTNPHVKTGLSWENVVWAFRTTSACNWHPLTWLSLMLDAELFGPGPFGPHLSNVLFHAANSVLLFLLLQRLTGAFWRSAFVAGLFALHPLHVESIAWISERKDVLSAFFSLLTLFFYGRYAFAKADNYQLHHQHNPLHQINRDYVLALVLFALALMSKPMPVTLPFVMLLLDWWPLNRVATLLNSNIAQNTSTKESTRQRPAYRSVVPLVLEKLPFFVLSALCSVVTLVAQQQAVRTMEQMPVSMRIVNAVVSYGRYLSKTFWPVNLAIPYPHPGYWHFGSVCLTSAVLIVVSLLVVWLRRKFPFLVTGWLWYLGMLVPVIGLVQVGPQSMADRYTYLPLIGVFIMVTWGISIVLARLRVPNVVTVISSAVILVACAVRTFDQLSYWQNTETLFKHSAAVTKNNYIAHYNLGHFYFRKNRIDDAIKHYTTAVQIRPYYDDALNNLGIALAVKGELEAALDKFRKAIEVAPHRADTYYNLGNVLVMQHKLDEAAAAYRQALVLNPAYPEAHNNLANVLAMLNRKEDAAHHYIEALRLNPHYDAAKRGLQMLGESKERSAH